MEFDSEVSKVSETRPDPVPSAEEVRAALNRLTASPAFGKAERPARFLTHLVETALAGKPECLKESVLGCDVFQREPTWDPRLDPIVRQEASRLRKRINRYHEEFGASDPLRISLPVGSYVPAFEWTAAIPPAPSSIASPKPEQPPPAGTSLWRWLGPLLFASIAVAVALVFWRHAHAATQKSLSVAVLPFQNATADPADQYFSDGITDEVADWIGRIKGLRVAPHSEVFKYKRNQQNLRQIAQTLNVSHLVQGKIERAGDSVTIVASLLRASDAKPLWTNTYRRHNADVSAIEADLAVAIGASLRLASPSLEVKHNPPAAAHDAYLKARYEATEPTVEANARAQQDFRRAIELDSEYAYAYHGLAQAIWNENIWAGKTPDIAERRKAAELWLKALQIAPEFAQAHSGLAAYSMQYDWDWPRAERELQAAVAVGDNAGVEQNYAYLCLILGRRADANRRMERAIELDPESNGRIRNSVLLFQLAGRFAEAETECRRWMNRNEHNVAPKLLLATLLAQQGKSAAAFKMLQSLPQNDPGFPATLAQINSIAGNRNEALRLLAPLEQNYREHRVFMYDIALVYATLGDAPNTTLWMQRSMDAREGPAMYIRIDPQLAKVQNDPAFRALKKRMNLDW